MKRVYAVKHLFLTTPRLISSILVTLLLVSTLMLVGSNTARAVTVSVSPSSSSVTQGQNITFTATVDIQSNERIPINAVTLGIFSDSGLTTELTTSPYSSPLTMTQTAITPTSGGYGYGTGYGYDVGYGAGYNFSSGYGYGGTNVTLTYTKVVSTIGWGVATYYAQVNVDSGTHVFSSSASVFSVTAAVAPGAPSGSSAGDDAESDDSGNDDAESDDTGNDDSGNDDAGSDNNGTQDSGNDDAGSDDNGQQDNGSNEPAPKPERVDLTEKVNAEGVATEGVEVTHTQVPVSANVAAGTICLDANRQPLKEIIVEPLTIPAPAPEGTKIFVATDFGPDGATFDPAISLTFDYDPALLGENVSESELVVAYYDVESEQWVSLTDVVVDMVNHTITAEVTHFTQFAVMTQPVSEQTSPVPADTQDTQVTGDVDEAILPDVDEDDGFASWYIFLVVIWAVIVFGVTYYWLNKRRSSAQNW